MENNNAQFVNYNGHILPKPEGTDYNLVPNKVYTMKQDKFGDNVYLEEDKDFEFPSTYYEEDPKFINKCITTFNNTEKLTTGVLLSGLKGSGKTLMAKKIAVESGLPIIVVDKDVSAGCIELFFSRIFTPVCVIFDEIDKYWNTRYLLGFLDGVKPTGKKLVVCTCNDEDEIDEYLNDRCSRIRYKKTFDSLNVSVIENVIYSIVGDKKKAKDAAAYIHDALTVVSYDNVIVFAEELKNYPDESFKDIVKDLNVEKK